MRRLQVGAELRVGAMKLEAKLDETESGRVPADDG
jgi:hypothetical protein